MHDVFYLAPDVLLRIIINKKDKFARQILTQNKVKVVTSSFCFYEVFSCLSEKEIEENSGLIKDLLRKIPIVDLSRDGTIERAERIKELRGVALSG